MKFLWEQDMLKSSDEFKSSSELWRVGGSLISLMF